MNVAEYVVDYLIELGVTDAFGVPGGVILDLLYAMESRKKELAPHLNYHEQTAAFAACGYAQINGKLGVAYATKGPGITNMITPMADAFCDSIPVLFLTAHSRKKNENQMRVELDQELDVISLVQKITKYAVSIDCLEDVQSELKKACLIAMSGRKGPVLIDFAASVLKKEMCLVKEGYEERLQCNKLEKLYYNEIIEYFHQLFLHTKHPVLLIGNGIRQSNIMNFVAEFAKKNKVPVISSRASQDIMQNSELYFGYIGSHGIRYANFILSKADLIIVMGNRMSFPIDSPSFKPIFQHAKVVRFEIDKTEFEREVPNCKNYEVDLQFLLPELIKEEFSYCSSEEWLSICNKLKRYLWDEDTNYPVDVIIDLLKKINPEIPIVCDVGNNEFWLSRANIYMGLTHRILYSNSFGALGCSLGKAIGVYYATRKNVICYTGDQGLQMNIQELQYIVQHNLPIMIVLINNESSGMIRSREKQKFNSHYVHTTKTSGYSVPDFKKIALALGLYYLAYEDLKEKTEKLFINSSFPIFVEVKVNEESDLFPNLPYGHQCQNMIPEISREKYGILEQL